MRNADREEILSRCHYRLFFLSGNNVATSDAAFATDRSYVEIFNHGTSLPIGWFFRVDLVQEAEVIAVITTGDGKVL